VTPTSPTIATPEVRDHRRTEQPYGWPGLNGSQPQPMTGTPPGGVTHSNPVPTSTPGEPIYGEGPGPVGLWDAVTGVFGFEVPQAENRDHRSPKPRHRGKSQSYGE
jgi:hypothetical protein